MRILGIETSCDETAAAVVEDGTKMLSNSIATSVDLHAVYGGVVPEIAARSHIESIIPVISEALKTAKTDWDQIDAIAVTYGPGLIGSLLIGVMTARTLAIAKNKPLYSVNHVQAHVSVSFITATSPALAGKYQLPASAPKFPILALIVSGGHTQLVLFKNHLKYKVLGQTLDDAVGEAFDKVAKIIGLPYPGGPAIAEAAKSGNSTSVKLPKAKLENSYDFSFSGLKTAVLRAAQEMAGADYSLPSACLAQLLSAEQKTNIAASFQRTAAETLVDGLETAVKELKPASIVIAGGVAANAELRRLTENRLKKAVFYPDIKLCTDNAGMIAALGYFQAKQQVQQADPCSLEPDPGLAM
jgi:N6-L-threonylcarbamoyladenine synthase